MTPTDDTIEQFIQEIISKKSELQQLLNPSKRILLITHTDMDGVGCEMVLRKMCSNIFPIYMSPSELDLVMETLDTRDFDTIFISDLCCSQDYILSDPRVITVDHHSTAKKFASTDKNIFVNEAVSATRLLYFFYKILTGKEDSYMDDFTTIVDDYDTWKMNDSRSYAFNYMFDIYGIQGFKERFGEDFNPEMTKDEWDKWYKEEKRIKDNVAVMPVYVKEYKGKCKIGVIVNSEYKNEYCEQILKDKSIGLDLLLYIWYPFGGSVRLNQDNTTMNIGELLQSLKIGGGHAYAGGFRSKDKTIAGTLEAMRKIMDEFANKISETDKQNFIAESLDENGEMPF